MKKVYIRGSADAIRTDVLEEPLQSFCTYLLDLGYRSSTLASLRCYVRFFLEWLFREASVSLTQVEAAHIRAYYNYLQERPNRYRPGGLSGWSIQGQLYALRLFFDYLQAGGELTDHPMSSLSFPAPAYTPRQPLSRSEIQALYGAAETLRDEAMLALFYGCGLRRSEGVRLNVSDVHLRSGLLYVREGKGGYARVVPLAGQVRDYLEAYILQGRKKARTGAVLLNRNGGRASGLTLGLRMSVLARKAGITKEAGLHVLRHSIATHLLENGLPVEQVQTFLGHKSLDTTQLYTRVNTKKLPF